MVKVTECCCGCSLRTGSLILLWITLIYKSIASLQLLNILVLSAYDHETPDFALTPYTAFRTVCYLIISIVGIIVSILGIHGIQKDLPKWLDGIFYYFCFEVIAASIEVIFMLVSPSSFVEIFGFNASRDMPSDSELRRNFVTLALGFSFGIALTIYFAVVLRSCRDAMIAKHRKNDFVDVIDPTTKGYSNAA